MFRLVAFVKTLIAPDAATSHLLRTTEASIPNTKPVVAAIVTQTIAPGRKGQVKFQGSWWTAQCNDEITLAIGELVRVIKRQDLTLYIEPLQRMVTNAPVTHF